MIRMSKKKTLEDQIRELDSSFVDEVVSATEEQLKDRLTRLAQYDVELDRSQADDQDLKDKKEIAAEATRSYSEPRKANKLKRQLVVRILSDRGKL